MTNLPSSSPTTHGGGYAGAVKGAVKAYQRTLEGGIKVATGNAIRDQLAAIMEFQPATIDDEDLLAAEKEFGLYRGLSCQPNPAYLGNLPELI